MSCIKNRYLLEQLIYAVIWLIMLAASVIMALLPDNFEVEYGFNRQIVLRYLKVCLLFFCIFLIHNYFLIPKFLFRKKIIYYISSILIVIAVVLAVDYNFLGKRLSLRPENRRIIERRMQENLHQMDRPLPEMRNNWSSNFRRPFPGNLFFFFFSHTLFILLLLGTNIAIRMLFKSIRDDEAIKELERHSLQSELEYLKYQINPHFFMNTLNNIYALIDIDAEKARNAVIELSKLMRYVLYEANKKTIPLSREVKFITNYVELMRLRYIDKVTVKLFLPDEIPDVEIAPLLYISFIENAFKHGVSYQSASLICIMVQVEESSFIFTCSNTNNGKSHEQYKGIGLDNIKKRLRLLYNGRYTLSINENTESFDVLLVIPLK